MTTIKHKVIKCNVKGCKQEATRWFDTAQVSGDFDMKFKDTFYLCLEHAEKISMGDDTYAYFLNPETGKMRQIELAVYSCSEQCDVCN